MVVLAPRRYSRSSVVVHLLLHAPAFGHAGMTLGRAHVRSYALVQTWYVFLNSYKDVAVVDRFLPHPLARGTGWPDGVLQRQPHR